MDTVEQIIRDVQAVCPDVDPNIARMWVRDAARRTMEFGPWSWLLRRGQFILPATVTNISSSATVSFTAGEDTITFSSGIATEAMVGRQIRTSSAHPIYDITGYISATQLRIFPAWGEANASAQAFTIFQSKVTLPEDCLELLSVVSVNNRWKLHLGVSQEALDFNDPSRSRGNSNPSLLSPFDYSIARVGSVKAPITVVGSGTRPIAGGTYEGQSDAVFTVEVTTGGSGGTAEFKWKKNEGSYTTGIVTDSTSGNSLQDGVNVLFPSSSTFTVGNVFVIRTVAGSSPGLARMEVYPYPSSLTVLPYLYVSRYPDVTDDNVALPGLLAGRGDILREKALEFCASWPGTEDRINPYNQINRRDYHKANWTFLVSELARQDNAMFQRNMQVAARMPWAPWPFGGAANFQEVDPWFMYPDMM